MNSRSIAAVHERASRWEWSIWYSHSRPVRRNINLAGELSHEKREEKKISVIFTSQKRRVLLFFRRRDRLQICDGKRERERESVAEIAECTSSSSSFALTSVTLRNDRCVPSVNHGRTNGSGVDRRKFACPPSVIATINPP